MPLIKGRHICQRVRTWKIHILWGAQHPPRQDMIIPMGIFYFVESISKKNIQLVIFVYQESKQGWKNILHFILSYIMYERMGH
jgi:hypothetical protein